MRDRAVRVLYVIDSLAPGGAETSLVAMAPGLRANGIDLHILPLGNALDLAPALTRLGVPVHERVGRPGRVGNVSAVLKTARRMKPDLIHTTLFESDLAGRTGARLQRLPCSTSLVNESYGSSHAGESHALKLRAARTLDHITASWASRFHAVSAAVADTVGPILKIQPNRIDVIPRGRDPHTLHFRPEETRDLTRTSLALEPEEKVILAVGRHEPQKGLQHLIAAVPIIGNAIPNAVVLVAGRAGRASELLREQIAHLPLEVRFLGHRTDIPALMAAADVLVFPSEREGSPGTLIEAMAVGIPIVSSDIAPCLEVLGGINPATALVTPVGDPAAIAEATITALTDPESGRRRATAARARFEERYTIDSVAHQMARFFSRVANPSQHGSGFSSPPKEI